MVSSKSNSSADHIQLAVAVRSSRALLRRAVVAADAAPSRPRAQCVTVDAGPDMSWLRGE